MIQEQADHIVADPMQPCTYMLEIAQPGHSKGTRKGAQGGAEEYEDRCLLEVVRQVRFLPALKPDTESSYQTLQCHHGMGAHHPHCMNCCCLCIRKNVERH